MFGDAAFCWVLRAKLPIVELPKPWSLRWACLLIALVAACLWLGLATAQMAGELDSSALVESLTSTLFGQLFLVRLAALLGMGLLLIFRRSGKLMAVLAGIALVVPAATSHAALASPAGFTAIGGIVDALHLLTASFWIGGLMDLALLFQRKEPNMVLALSLFSEWAMIAVLLLLMTGLINAASILLGGKGNLSALYAGLLGAKLVLVAVMLWLAGANRFKFLPKAREDIIARNVVFELSIGAIVVLLGGALGQLQPLL